MVSNFSLWFIGEVYIFFSPPCCGWMRVVLGCIRFSPNSGFLMLNAHHAAVPSRDLLNAYDLKSSSVSERIIMENVTCNPLLLHSAGHVIDFQKKKKKKVTVQILLGKAEKSCSWLQSNPGLWGCGCIWEDFRGLGL